MYIYTLFCSCVHFTYISWFFKLFAKCNCVTWKERISSNADSLSTADRLSVGIWVGDNLTQNILSLITSYDSYTVSHMSRYCVLNTHWKCFCDLFLWLIEVVHKIKIDVTWIDKHIYISKQVSTSEDICTCNNKCSKLIAAMCIANCIQLLQCCMPFKSVLGDTGVL